MARMTDRQRKVLTDAFTLLGGAARLGKRKAETETVSVVIEHVTQMEEMLREMRKALDAHAGASAVLDAAAKPGRILYMSKGRA